MKIMFQIPNKTSTNKNKNKYNRIVFKMINMSRICE